MPVKLFRLFQCSRNTQCRDFKQSINNRCEMHRNGKKEKKKVFQGHFDPEQNVFAYVSFNCKFIRVWWSTFELKDLS